MRVTDGCDPFLAICGEPGGWRAPGEKGSKSGPRIQVVRDLARGIFIDVRHRPGCPAQGIDPAACRCSPYARAKVKRKWVASATLRKGWRLKDLDPLEAEATRRREDHDSGRSVIERRKVPRLAEWGERWLDNIERLVELREYAPNTLATYRSMWRNHIEPLLGDRKLTTINVQAVNELVQAMHRKRLAHTHVRQARTLLGAMLGDAIPQYLDFNPVKQGSRRRGGSSRGHARTEPRKRVMPLDVAQAILATTTGHLHEQILCGLTTGMRKQEICGLPIERVDFAARRIYVEGQWDDHHGERPPKWGSVRAVPLCRPLADALQLRAERVTSGPLWIDPDTGLPYMGNIIQKRFNQAWEAVAERQPRQSWHTTRHTFSTMLDQAGVREVVIDEIMGHRPGSVSRIYRHGLEADIDGVIEILDRVWSPAEARTVIAG